MDELEDGSDLGGSDLDVGADDSATAAPESNPWDEPLSDLRASVSAMEGRFGEQLSPLQQQLQQMQRSFASRTAVEVPDDKLAAIEALFTSYDPKFEGVGELLKDLLTSSVSSQPLSADSIRPLIADDLAELQYETATARMDAMMDKLQFNMAELDAEGWTENPQTDGQKLFLKWWDRQDQATRTALTAKRNPERGDFRPSSPLAFAKAMSAFDQFYRTQTAQSSQSAGDASRRLAGATQTRSSGRSTPGGSQLRTEADGFASVFKAAS